MPYNLIDIMSLQKGLMRSDGAYTQLVPPGPSGWGFLYQIKRFSTDPKLAGFPFDCIAFKDVCTDRVTERDKAGWLNPEDIKIHIGNDGIGTLIGSLNVAAFPMGSEITPSADYIPFYNGQTDLIPKSVGAAQNVWELIDKPLIDWGGQVGKCPTFIRNYFWSWDGNHDNPPKKRERYWYARDFANGKQWGELMWDTSDFDPVKGYVVQQTTGPFNTFKPLLNPPPVNFPMFGKATI